VLSSSAIVSHFFILSQALVYTFVTVQAFVNFKLCSSTSSEVHTTSIVSFKLQLETVSILVVEVVEVVETCLIKK
jgi:hypothetical protein